MKTCVICGQPVYEDREPAWCNASISADPDGWARAVPPDPEGEAREARAIEIALLDFFWPPRNYVGGPLPF